MDPFQDAGPSNSQSQSQSHYDTEDHMAATPGAGRKRVGFTSDAPRPFSTNSPDEADTGSGGHNTPLQRPDVTQDDLSAMRESLRLALAEEHYQTTPPPAQVIPPEASNLPRDVQKPRPAIRKGPRTPPEFYLNDNPFDDNAETLPSVEAELKQRSGLAAQQRAARLSKSVGTYSAPVSRRNSRELMSSPPVELQNLARTYDYVDEAVEDEDDPQFMKRASMILRQHTVRVAEPGLITPEDLYHTDAPLQSGQVTPDTIEVEDERVSRPTKYRTGVLGTLLRANTAAQGPPAAGRPPRSGHFRTLSTGTFSGASTAANSPNSSPPQSGYSTPRAARPWFRQHNNQSASSISQLVGSSARSLATPAQHDLGQEFDEQYKKSRPGMGKRSKSDESILGFKKAKRRDNEIKIKIHL